MLKGLQPPSAVFWGGNDLDSEADILSTHNAGRPGGLVVTWSAAKRW